MNLRWHLTSYVDAIVFWLLFCFYIVVIGNFLLQELCSCQTVILSVDDEVGQRIIIDDLLEATRNSDAGLRQAAVTMLNGYFARTRLDYSAHTRNLLSGLIHLLNDTNPEVLSQSWDTINSITKVCSCEWMFPIYFAAGVIYRLTVCFFFFLKETGRKQPAGSNWWPSSRH